MESKFLSLLGLSIFHLRPSRPSLQPSWFSIYPKATTTYSVIHGKCCRSWVDICIGIHGFVHLISGWEPIVVEQCRKGERGEQQCQKNSHSLMEFIQSPSATHWVPTINCEMYSQDARLVPLEYNTCRTRICSTCTYVNTPYYYRFCSGQNKARLELIS